MAMMLATLATMLPMYRSIILPDQTTTNICKGATHLIYIYTSKSQKPFVVKYSNTLSAIVFSADGRGAEEVSKTWTPQAEATIKRVFNRLMAHD
jgi:hypothetical protein